MQPTRVRILDHDYLVKSEEDARTVHKIAEYVNEKLKEIGDNTEGLSQKKTAILAALNIASEYFQLLKERSELLNRIQDRAEALIHHIDSTMD